jgi:hypothetical protein
VAASDDPEWGENLLLNGGLMLQDESLTVPVEKDQFYDLSLFDCDGFPVDEAYEFFVPEGSASFP